MKSSVILWVASLLAVISGCVNDWDQHYGVYPETVDQNVWDAMKSNEEISQFVQLLVENKFDTLFKSDNAYSVFAPSNAALQAFLSNNENKIDTTLLKYHFFKNFVQLSNIPGNRRVQTYSGKFALLQKSGKVAMLDGKLINYESPLFENGNYFIIEEVASPLPNLYEFFSKNNKVIKDYKDRQDSIILDPERSIPIGFDDDGNTIYDSVTLVYNIFEEEFFPVSKEFRNRTATIVFPLEDDYNNALTEMAQSIGGDFIDYRDIPIVWQQEILVPYLLEQGVFDNMLEPEAFVWKSSRDTLKLKNVLGDSVQILYSPVDKATCSNGYAYNYTNFSVPEPLYKLAVRLEAESLLDNSGIDRYVWNNKATVISDDYIVPYKEFVSTASNDSILRVLFPLGYNGNYSLEFKTNYLFPRSYVMTVRTNMDYGGIYDIYVNDELVKTFDYYTYVKYRGGIIPSVMGGFLIPTGRFNSFDFFVENITEFGKPKVRFEYKGPGKAPSQGLVIDYIDFLPAPN